jgi:hypothetical protein
MTHFDRQIELTGLHRLDYVWNGVLPHRHCGCEQQTDTDIQSKTLCDAAQPYADHSPSTLHLRLILL